MTIAVIDYGSGNLRSAAKALERVAPGGIKIHITADPEDLKRASHIVLPGVGAYGDCMRGLASISGMLEALSEEVQVKKKPFLGICVGMQLLFERGHEHGVHDGLGWLKGEVVSLSQQPATSNQQLKIPHMGWNELTITPHPLLAGIDTGAHAYFVHSYHAAGSPDVIATTSYGQTIAAVVAKGNIMGTQFHPEKSQETGLRLLSNFVRL
ncbi:MAG: imidazole glycerol phosphate synthase subunit HisH [Rickettsiales bacterium]|jgi:glutamine amidotransferase|nr:imidazole glycerol phosphate synthase subunit HisH [Rickettsiales bacterium]